MSGAQAGLPTTAAVRPHYHKGYFPPLVRSTERVTKTTIPGPIEKYNSVCIQRHGSVTIHSAVLLTGPNDPICTVRPMDVPVWVQQA